MKPMMKPILFATCLALLAGCGRFASPIEPRIDAPASAAGTSTSTDGPPRDIGAVPMPSGISCQRNASGYPDNCTQR